MSKYGMLVLFCGKMGSGKSTKAAEIAQEMQAVLVSEDEWLSQLYPGEITTFQDYIKYSSRLKPVIKAHVQSILNSGVSVVMDFPGNTINQRSWLKEIFQARPYPHKLVYLETDDKTCLDRLKHRQKLQPERAKFDNPEVFKQVTAHFETPSSSEGFIIETITQSGA